MVELVDWLPGMGGQRTFQVQCDCIWGLYKKIKRVCFLPGIIWIYTDDRNMCGCINVFSDKFVYNSCWYHNPRFPKMRALLQQCCRVQTCSIHGVSHVMWFLTVLWYLRYGYTVQVGKLPELCTVIAYHILLRIVYCHCIPYLAIILYFCYKMQYSVRVDKLSELCTVTAYHILLRIEYCHCIPYHAIILYFSYKILCILYLCYS